MQQTVDNYVKFVFRKMDSQSRGRVTYEEFNEVMKKMPNLLEVVDVLNEGMTSNANKNNAPEMRDFSNNMEKTIKKVDISINQLQKYLYSLEKTQKEDPGKKNERKRGPEFGHYVIPVQFDKEEEKFGLEENKTFSMSEENAKLLNEINEMDSPMVN